MAASVRFRAGNTLLENSQFSAVSSDKAYNKLPSVREKPHNVLYFVAFILFYCVIYVIVHHQDTNLPAPKSAMQTKPDEFCEERARAYLNDITGLGPRFVGSEANEIHSVILIEAMLQQIKSNAHPANKVDIDIQRNFSGSFDLEFLGRFTSNYRNMNNVLARIGPPTGSKDSLLVNCHYDSTAGSPGASDDATSCSIMLEVLRALSVMTETLPNDIIFIFNGAEENILQASHGFITQHPWAKTVRAFINLESAGSGGRELVFQTGPEHPWLIQAYAKAAKHPFASSIGEEIFQSGVIPSDTDFRIYRDFGNIPGIDIAYISNGYVYHTKYDRPEFIEPGCLQRGGDNLLATVKHLVASTLLRNPESYKNGNMVFFDMVGLYLVIYSERVGVMLNCMVVFAALLYMYRKRKDCQGSYLICLTTAVGVQVIGWLVCLLTCVSISLVMTYLKAAMAWYTHTINIIGLYVCPAILAMATTHHLADLFLFKSMQPKQKEDLFFDANIVIWAVTTATLTSQGKTLAFLPMMWVLFPILIRDRLARIPSVKHLLLGWPHLEVTFHLASVFVPSLLTTYMFYGLFEMFIPVLGRTGTANNIEVVVAIMAAAMVILLSCCQVCYFYSIRGMKTFVYCWGTVSVLWFIAMLVTPLGFPYRGDPTKPALQRHIAHHVDRHFYDINGDETKTDSGILFIPFDNNQLQYVQDVPRVNELQIGECADEPYCGWPYYYPMLTMMIDKYYMPASKLKIIEKTELKMLDRSITSMGRVKLLFSFKGPDHSALYVAPKTNVTLQKWSLGDGFPKPTKMPAFVKQHTYFAYFSYGSKPQEPWMFWMEFAVPKGYPAKDGILDIAVGGHYINKQRFTPELEEFLGKFPDWTYIMGWSATYDAFVY